MTLQDIIAARCEWSKAHGRIPRTMLVPECLDREVFDAFKRLPVRDFLAGDDFHFKDGFITRVLGMRLQRSPFKTETLDFG